MYNRRRGQFGQTAPARTNAGTQMAMPPMGNGGGCVPIPTCGPTFYNLPGNAGIPGCDVSTLCGTECHYQILGRVIRDVPACEGDALTGPLVSLEMSALRAGAFKPRYVYMFGIGSECSNSTENARFELAAVEVQGMPQLIATQGDSNPASPAVDGGNYAVLSDAFVRPDHPLPVSWATFGTDSGQRISFSFRSLVDFEQDIYVVMWGDAADSSMVGNY